MVKEKSRGQRNAVVARKEYHQLMSTKEMTIAEKEAAKLRVIDSFPVEFGLRNYPNYKFRISETASYWSDEELMIYTQIQRDGKWLDFCKGTAYELRSQITHLEVQRG